MISMESTNRLDLFDGIPPRTWVALSADRSRVVATGGTYGEAVDGADSAGVFDPILVIAPPKDGIPVYIP